MKLYLVTLVDYECSCPQILYHEDENIDFDELVKKVIIQIIEDAVSADDRDKHHLLLEEYTFQDAIVHKLVKEWGFVLPEIDEFEFNSSTFYRPLILDREGSPFSIKTASLPNWIPEDLQAKMLEVTEKFKD
jgi:hypothetical protein